MATVKVWDPLVRLFHWGLVVSFVVAWISADEWDALHLWAGYAAGALIAFRLVWGVLGTRTARFSSFVRSPAAVIAYLSDVLHGREARYIGHNPAGGAMIVALLLALAGLCLTGWLVTTDAYLGMRWLKHLHELMANLLLLMVGLHLAGVVLASLRHQENLVRAMIVGRKRAPSAADMD